MVEKDRSACLRLLGGWGDGDGGSGDPAGLCSPVHALTHPTAGLPQCWFFPTPPSLQLKHVLLTNNHASSTLFLDLWHQCASWEQGLWLSSLCPAEKEFHQLCRWTKYMAKAPSCQAHFPLAWSGGPVLPSLPQPLAPSAPQAALPTAWVGSPS